MNQNSLWAQEMLNRNAVILDTETTGVDKAAQVIQLCIIDMRGNMLFDSLFRPTVEIDSRATATHHITKYHLRNSPAFTDCIEQIRNLLNGCTVIAYNVGFDRRMLGQTLKVFNLDGAWFEQLDWQCAMRAYAEYLGVKNSPKLEGGDHTAMGDCLATLKLLRCMADTESQKDESSKKIGVGSTGCELLTYLAPPIELIEHLERYQEKGKLPSVIVDWIQRWRDIRGDGVSDIDGTTPEKWTEVSRLVKREKEFA